PYMSFFSLIIQRPPSSTLFPSTTLFRSAADLAVRRFVLPQSDGSRRSDRRIDARENGRDLPQTHASRHDGRHQARRRGLPPRRRDRKSTRLNSSHVKISYAVFCLKKKTQ